MKVATQTVVLQSPGKIKFVLHGLTIMLVINGMLKYTMLH